MAALLSVRMNYNLGVGLQKDSLLQLLLINEMKLMLKNDLDSAMGGHQ